MKKTTAEKMQTYRSRVLLLKQVVEIIPYWFQSLYERGKEIARSSITELDVTAQFENTNDKMIALFASLAAPEDSQSFATLDFWNGYTPTEMVSKRLFLDIPQSAEYSAVRMKRIMDMLWRWSKDYYSLYDAFELLLHEPEPLDMLTWMMTDVPIPDSESRLPKLLMAMMMSDDGIGQGIMLHKNPENLSVPLTRSVKQFRRNFCSIQDMSMGEFANCMGLLYETDLYYLALGWQELVSKYPPQAKHISQRFKFLANEGIKDYSQKNQFKKYVEMIEGL